MLLEYVVYIYSSTSNISKKKKKVNSQAIPELDLSEEQWNVFLSIYPLFYERKHKS
jgi:hypothetical protein